MKPGIQRIELLSPARTADSGIMAINFGADAVYIGAPVFSARAAAGNEVGDIARLVSYARKYYARVFVAFNTILYDHELEPARTLIGQLHEAGVDALIIQDMGILRMDLPPVELHASTQTNNYELSRIQFLEKAGFRRVVLARELTLEQIREIRAATTLELECFVHGALCVSLSGQCYMSEAQGGRSGNRGVCAQPCRKLYDLVDADGRILEKQKHLLSLKDLNLGDHLAEMALAGVSSFKIEGRLKDDNYLKNITAYYRKKIDAFMDGRPDFRKASSGNVWFDFIPDPGKTFSRGTGNYFLFGRTPDMVSFDTPKSAGEYIGKVIHSNGNSAEIDTGISLANNDGLCYFNAGGVLEGVKVNIADGRKVEFARKVGLLPGTRIYRNYDHEFSETLRRSQTSRKVEIRLEVSEFEDGLVIVAEDEDCNLFSLQFKTEKTVARDRDKALAMLREQLSKSGDTIFDVTEVELKLDNPLFFPVSVINRIRREFLDKFLEYRLSCFEPGIPFTPVVPDGKYFSSVDYTWNVSNRLSEDFYREHGAGKIEPAVEISRDYSGKKLMTMKHCLKYQLGYCPREKGHNKGEFREPLYLVDGRRRFRLEFDCQSCRMNLYQD